MVSINTNLSSILVQNNLTKSTNALNRAIERMTTGFKINHASDNAANYSIAEDYSSKLSSFEVASDNASMGLDLLQTASDSLSLVQNHLSRIRDLAEQASNGTYGDESMSAIQAEVEARVSEINRILANTDYNNIQILNNSVSEENSKFLKPITRLTEEEAIAQGYNIIKTADDLKHMDLGKNILMNDIDMEGEDWSTNTLYEELNGNGYSIKNLYCEGNFINLFYEAKIKNLAMENCKTHGNIFSQQHSADQCSIENCYIENKISGYNALQSIYSVSDSIFSENIGSFQNATNTYQVQQGSHHTNIYQYHNSNSNEPICYTDDPDGWEHGYHNPSELPEDIYNKFYGNDDDSPDINPNITFQVGIYGDSSSQITVNTEFGLDLSLIDVSSHTSAQATLGAIDTMMSTISSKQTEFGSAQNRLESVIESITVSMENLTSSRSTIKDADIAQVSSEYIRQQILQQASATLLATANQSPSIALQLI